MKLSPHAKSEIFDWSVLILGILIVFLAAKRSLGAIWCLPVAIVYSLQFNVIKKWQRRKKWIHKRANLIRGASF